MQEIKKIIQEQQQLSLQGSLPANLDQTGCSEISVYQGALTTEAKIRGVATIKKAFPALPLDFYDVFIDRLEAAGFSDKRLEDAVAHVIDSCIYPQPTIAQFISFDKRIKLYSYEEMIKKAENGLWSEAFQPIKLKGRTSLVWIHVDDINKYNIKSEE